MNSELYENYIVKKGNTIFGISKQFNINPELLSLINGLNMNDYIYEDQNILIPRSNYSYYMTKSGDSLEDVLKLFNVDYDTFFKENINILLDEGQLFAHKR